jgi:hypothetical protein
MQPANPRPHRFSPALFARLRTAAAALAVIAAASWPAAVQAYDEWSTDGSSGNCAECHGDFRAGGYVSKNDGVAWNTSLHNGHRNTMLSGECDVCHGSGDRFPVALGSSVGLTGFPPIGCLGCHGRAEPMLGNQIKGTGLRQHHDRSGIAECRGCHPDANPATVTPAEERTLPPYYFTPDADHPNKPTDPCGPGLTEARVAPPLGLDNDGDLAYDASDTDCTVPIEETTWGRVKSVYR